MTLKVIFLPIQWGQNFISEKKYCPLVELKKKKNRSCLRYLVCEMDKHQQEIFTILCISHESSFIHPSRFEAEMDKRMGKEIKFASVKREGKNMHVSSWLKLFFLHEKNSTDIFAIWRIQKVWLRVRLNHSYGSYIVWIRFFCLYKRQQLYVSMSSQLLL